MTTPTSAVAQAVAHHAAQGARIESQADEVAVVVYGSKPSGLTQLMHVLLAVVTLGLWIPVAAIVMIEQGRRVRRIVITPAGETRYRWLFGKWRPTNR